MASLLNNYQQDVLDRRAYFDALGVYSRSHQLKLPDGKIVPWIDEDQNPFTGDWIVRRKPCYSASQSVLGGRLKQPIKDIASQIEVITPEFISDFAITSVADAFRYSLNVENGEEFLTPSDGGEREAWSGKTHGRIRGIFPSKFST